MIDLEFIDKGGALMIPIALASVVGLTIFFERWWATRSQTAVPRGLFRALSSLIEDGEFAQARALAKDQDSALARIVAVALRHRGRSRSHLKETLEETVEQELANLERRTTALSVVATITPLLGLLGTVTGMIKVFRDVAGHVDPDISILAGGIWEALITTAAGLTVAIPAFALHRTLLSRIDHIASELAGQGIAIIDLLDPGEGESSGDGS
jgi:biopolymer transport protein ExbB